MLDGAVTHSRPVLCPTSSPARSICLILLSVTSSIVSRAAVQSRMETAA
jgi:hypothetical protein